MLGELVYSQENRCTCLTMEIHLYSVNKFYIKGAPVLGEQVLLCYESFGNLVYMY